MIRPFHTILVLIVFLALALLSGCSGDNASPPFPFKMGIDWSARTRQLTAPASALSCKISLYVSPGMTGTPSYQWVVNRSADPAAYTLQWTAPSNLPSPRWYVEIAFYDQADGTGDIVAIGKQYVMLDLGGKGGDTVTLNGTIDSVTVAANQTVPLGGTQDLLYSVKDAAGQLIAITPGSVSWSVSSNPTAVGFNSSGFAQGLALGIAQVIATIDGKASPATKVAVTDVKGYTLLAAWGASGNGNGQFSHAGGIAVSADGYVYVTDVGNNRVEVFDTNGQFVRQWTNEAWGNLHSPTGITVDKIGRIAVADTDGNRVLLFNSMGTFIGQFGAYQTGPDELIRPMAIAFDSDNRAFIADGSLNRVAIFDVQGTVTPIGIDYLATGVALDNHNNCYISVGAEGRVVRCNSLNQIIASLGSTGLPALGGGSGHLQEPRGLAVDAAGNLYVADATANVVWVLDQYGQYLQSFGTIVPVPPVPGPSMPWGVAVDNAGNVYVANYNVTGAYLGVLKYGKP